jgi:glycopeptide antibiotics resistance protein
LGDFDQPLSAGSCVLSRRQYGWLTALVLALVLYGSLVPLHFHFVPLAEAVDKYRAALDEPVRMESRSDWAANILLFIPLSFLLMATLSVDQRRITAWLAAPLVLCLCTLLSAAIEFTQLYFPPRVTSVNDVVAESVGGLVGISAWLMGGQWFTLRLRSFWVNVGGQGSTGSILLVYIIFLALSHAMPMDLTISPVEIYHKYREGRIRLLPWAGWSAEPFALVQKCVTNIAFFMPVGFLASGLRHPFWRRSRNWLKILGLGLGLAGLIEFLQLFVYTRYCESLDVVTGGLGVLAGWALATSEVPASSPPAFWRTRLPLVAAFARRRAPDSSPGAPRRALLGLWVALLIFVNWQPFDFDFSLAGTASGMERLCLIPFADYQQQDYLSAFDQICSKTAMFMPVGALLVVAGFRQQRPHPGLWMVGLSAVLPSILEAGQFFLSTHYPSVTDVLIETFGTWLGFFVAARLVRIQ